ncbi:hypothetical protein EDD11_005526 [Mortierella claussenii]|nr:hypothetical protein EDD11_005526 [Mortierella claussenii]
MNFIQFIVADDRPDDHARIQLKIQVPLQFDKSLFVQGVFANISSSSLADTNFFNLYLVTEYGHITLKDAVRAAKLRLWVKQKGGIHTGWLRRPYRGKGFEASVQTKEGDIFMNAAITKYREGYAPTAEEHFFLIKASEGNIHLHIKEEKEDANDDDVIPGYMLVDASTVRGNIQGRIDVLESQKVSVGATSSHQGNITILLSDDYSGKLSVTASPNQHAAVVPKAGSKSQIRFDLHSLSKKRGTKHSGDSKRPGTDGEQVNLSAHEGKAALIFVYMIAVQTSKCDVFLVRYRLRVYDWIIKHLSR